MIRSTKVAVFVASLTLNASVLAGSGHDSLWGYEGLEGPEHWAELSKEYAVCGTGTRQSPIDIPVATPAKLPPIKFDFEQATLEILNNGHTIQVNHDEGSSITVDGERFDLLQFHFHTPSENTVGGKHHDMELHMVHKSAKGQLAVVGVFMTAGKENKVLSNIWEHMPSQAGDKKKVNSVRIHPVDLLPADRSYSCFNGSLTTPPCSEGVKWFVMKNPIEVSAGQIEKFTKTVSENNRPVQPLNGRFVLTGF